MILNTKVLCHWHCSWNRWEFNPTIFIFFFHIMHIQESIIDKLVLEKTRNFLKFPPNATFDKKYISYPYSLHENSCSDIPNFHC